MISSFVEAQPYQECLDKSMSSYDFWVCNGTELKKWDALLNSRYKSKMKSLSPKQQHALRTKQRKWINDRDSDCQPYFKKYHNGEGTMYRTIAGGCLVDWTKKRAEELK